MKETVIYKPITETISTKNIEEKDSEWKKIQSRLEQRFGKKSS